MKEIDINIEGYNVNGICVGCLNYDRKMYYRDDVKEIFKILGNIDVPDGLNIQVCWECLAAVNRCMRFKEQISKSYEILIDYSRQQTFLNSPEDLTLYATINLSSPGIEVTDSTELQTLKYEANDELQIDFEVGLKDETITELDTIKIEPFDSQESYSDDFKYEDDSNEDIQLSELKREKVKKEKRGRKKKKKTPDPTKSSRKLKNLPLDIIELYSMSEAEMVSVRAADRASELFLGARHRCDLCVLCFSSQRLREGHEQGKHSELKRTPHQCDVCLTYLLSSESLAAHRNKHLTAYRCKLCFKSSTLKMVMAKHLCVQAEERRYKCAVCEKEFITQARLNYHRSICAQEKPQCDCCGKVFANKMTLKYHLTKMLPQNKEEKPKEKLYIPCKGCNKVFNSKKSYRSHVVIHDNIKHPCPTCGKLFRWKRNLSRHTRAHREREQGGAHRCAPCGKRFSSRDCLNNHLRLSKAHATHARLHQCTYCGKKFITKWALVDHVDYDHLKKIKYQCGTCFKAFKTSKIMMTHINNIHGGKSREEDDGEHLCDICGKSYKTVKRLKGHVWAMHTQRAAARSFKCKLCAATFTWQTSIYKHMKIMHDDKRPKPPRAPPRPPYAGAPYFPLAAPPGHAPPMPGTSVII